MATADKVKALIRSHADHEGRRFHAILMEGATQVACSEHGELAQDLSEPARPDEVAGDSTCGEIAMPCEQAPKDAILGRSTSVRDAEVVAALEERGNMRQGAVA